MLSGERGGKENSARRLAASTGLQSLPWLFVLCCYSFLFLDQDESQGEVLSPQQCHDSEQSLQGGPEAAGFLSLLTLQ